MNPYGIPDKLFSFLMDWFKNHPEIDSVILFGSRAKGNFKNGSDIDLCLHGENLTFTDISALKIALDELHFAYKYDFLIYSKIKDDQFKKAIDHSGTVIYKK